MWHHGRPFLKWAKAVFFLLICMIKTDFLKLVVHVYLVDFQKSSSKVYLILAENFSKCSHVFQYEISVYIVIREKEMKVFKNYSRWMSRECICGFLHFGIFLNVWPKNCSTHGKFFTPAMKTSKNFSKCRNWFTDHKNCINNKTF